MSKLMQSHIVLKAHEIDVAVNALQQSIAHYINTNAEYLAIPYQIILSRIQEVRKYGTGDQADITLVGGNINCMFAALQIANLNAEDSTIAAHLQTLVKTHTQGMATRYA